MINRTNWKNGIITRRADGSYVVPYKGYSAYHVPNDGEFAALWAEIDAYAAGRPEQVADEPAPPAPTLEEAKAAKLAEINAQCDALLKSLVATYPETEQQTFYKQDAESAAYLADASAKTPFLAGLAAARGISLEEMVHRVRAKTDAFVALSASVCGQRQAMEDALDACETVEAVQALAVSYQTAGVS